MFKPNINFWVSFFQFSIIASDQGIPISKNCTTMYRFTVVIDKPPYCNPVNYTWAGLTDSAYESSMTFIVNGFDDDRQVKKKKVNL